MAPASNMINDCGHIRTLGALSVSYPIWGGGNSLTNEERDTQRKLRVLQHAEKIGNALSSFLGSIGHKEEVDEDTKFLCHPSEDKGLAMSSRFCDL